MTHDPNIEKIELDVTHFFSSELTAMWTAQKWNRDSQWTDGIHKRMTEIGHRYDCSVFACKTRCSTANGTEWLYDHHWRIVSEDGTLVRIPLAMEIEWGFGRATIHEKIKEDFLKLVQARADLRVMVFQCEDVTAQTEKLIAMAKSFEGSQQGDRWLFAGFDWGANQVSCRLWRL